MTPTLSKSKYLAGCQCTRRLWFRCHMPELAVVSEGAQTRRLDVGTEIGRRAHALFPGGVLVDEDASQHREAVERTRTLLADASVPAIFEGAFTHAGVRIRVDVLERLADGAWGLREVKSAASVKEEHLHDVAVQHFVLEGAGLRVPSVEVIHVNSDYVRGDGGIDWQQFFHRADVTEAVEPLRADVPGRVQFLHAVLALDDAPAIEPSRHCFAPRECEFWTHCTREKPVDWIFHLPGRPDRFEALRAAGIERISDIPDDFPLSGAQARVRAVLREGGVFVSSDLGAALAAAGPPACYLDFETMNPAIPPYPGTRPYQRIPFQWSLHRLDEAGVLEHREFLARGRVDPRREFAATLLDALGGRPEPVLVYSHFEADVLGEVARAVPEHAGALAGLRARLVDLLPVVRRHVYHRDFGGSFSLKAVAPALVPGFGYEDLEGVAGGDEAAQAFTGLAQDLAQGAVSEAEEAHVRSALLAYCRRDTLALVELHRALGTRALAVSA
jgi:predicted RecB family nuclease